MAEAHLHLDDEDLEYQVIGNQILNELVRDARRVCDSDSSTKEEVVAQLSSFLDLFESILEAGNAWVQGSVEINEITKAPDTTQQ